MAATVGIGRSSKTLKTSKLILRIFSAISASLPPNCAANSVMSAPTMKTGLPLVTITPLSDVSAAIAAVASFNSLTVSALNLLTESSCRSKQSSAMPSSVACTIIVCPE